MLKILAVFFLILSSTPVWGIEPSPQVVATLAEQARQKNIAHHPYWLALLHYHREILGTVLKSEVSSPDFFLAPQGNVDPESELDATLAAFLQPPGEDQNEHAQCRFVARYHWLRKMLDWSQVQTPQVSCQLFSNWSKNGHITSISLIFATGYFSNPASYYGHLLLKFNEDRNLLPTDLLDESLNFGAVVPEHENPLRYLFKGIFGFYDAAFSSTGFYRTNHSYAENELRDMWEYELALSPDEVEQITAHTWELLRTRYAYYFFKQNCAYRMSQLLGLVIDQPLLSPSLPWSVPSSVFDHLIRVKRDGKPLVHQVKRISSRLNRYREQYHRLDNDQQNIVSDFVERHREFAQTGYPSLNTSEQIAVVDTLRDYYQFRIVGASGNTDYKTRKLDLLIERSRLPVLSDAEAMQESAQNAMVLPPHDGSPPGLIRIGVLQNNKLGTGETVQLRPVYFDNLEADAGRVANANLTMFDMSATHIADRWQIRDLDLVKIEHLNIADTPLSGDGGWAWRVRFGLKSENLSCRDCLTGHVTGGIGKAVKLIDDAVAYAMLDGIAQTRYLDSGTLGVSPGLGLLAMPVEGWKTSLVLNRRTYLNGNQNSAPQVSWENRFGLARDWDVRINYRYSVASEWQMAISTYW